MKKNLKESLKALSANPVRTADWLLRLGVTLHTAGLAVALLGGAGSGLGGVALMEWGIAHDPIFLTERIAAVVLLSLAVSLWFMPAAPTLVVITLAIVAECLARYRFGGEYFSEYTLLTHAPRYLVPIALLCVLQFRRAQPRASWLQAGLWILRMGLVTVFFIHGVEALLHNPRFIDLIIGSMYRVFSLDVSESAARMALTVIGAVDVLVALIVLIRPGRRLLYWMCFWGLLTALSRPLAMGFASYPDVLLRASHFLAPLALWLLVRYARERGAVVGSLESGPHPQPLS